MWLYKSCDCVSWDSARTLHTHTHTLSLVSVFSQSTGTIESIVQLAGPCVPTPRPYLSTETGVFLLVTQMPCHTSSSRQNAWHHRQQPPLSPHTQSELENYHIILIKIFPFLYFTYKIILTEGWLNSNILSGLTQVLCRSKVYMLSFCA